MYKSQSTESYELWINNALLTIHSSIIPIFNLQLTHWGYVELKCHAGWYPNRFIVTMKHGDHNRKQCNFGSWDDAQISRHFLPLCDDPNRWYKGFGVFE